MRLRGRKGIKEELERQNDLVVLNPAEHKGQWSNFFGNRNPIHVELGMGKGRFISEMSIRHKNINFIGADRYDELVRKASEKARAAGKAEAAPPNLALALFNIEYIEDVFAAGEIDRIYLNFSDPWPKKRHAARRLTHPKFLDKYSRLLREKGEIHFKTDCSDLFEFSLNSFADTGLRMRNISLNLHKEGHHPDHVMTEYEMKFVEQGMPIYRCAVMMD
jgi:tRNA (guanine-N7-)-methyltransferase